jgi:hypothetical protein
MRGIHVWNHVKGLDRRPNSDRPPEVPDSILIHGEVARRLPMEHTEAAVDEALTPDALKRQLKASASTTQVKFIELWSSSR